MRALKQKPKAERSLAVVASAPAGHLVGRMEKVDSSGLWVTFPGGTSGPVKARTTLALDEKAWRAAEGREALLVFEQHRADRPIVVGLLSDFPQEGRPLDVTVDGKRIAFEASDEIVLRCGKASLTLRRNGRVIIRGAYVESESTGVNRIKGGCVKLN